MLSLLRLFAVLTMLLALTGAVLVLPECWNALTSRGVDGEGDGPLARQLTLTGRVQRATGLLHRDASLFCFGGILYLLARIAQTQEEGTRADPTPRNSSQEREG